MTYRILKIKLLALLGVAITLFQCETAKTVTEPHIMFVIGDEEYRSEESMPMLARIVAREMGARVTLCYSLDSAGFIDPNRLDHIEGLEGLQTADLMIMFTRFRALPPNELKYITEYVDSGKPVVGFRTSTHAFLYQDSSLMHMNNEWPTRLFGQQWITHHGHFDDGANPLTEVSITEGVEHPILNGFNPFEAYSWLYHVDGGDWQLYGDSQPLLIGRSLKSGHEMAGRLDQFPLTNPVAWTKSYTSGSGEISRIFFTTLGHPYDWKNESMRKIALNGILWALGREIEIPLTGVNAEIIGTYEPSNSGFGQKFISGRKPESIP